LIRSLTLTVLLLAATALPITAQSKLDFTLKNDTGVVISEIFVSPSTSEDWEEDIMGRDVLANNESVDIAFSRTEKTCEWDLKIVDEHDNEIEWTELDLCTASHITLQYKGKKATAIIK
jgi:hypothetical protein